MNNLILDFGNTTIKLAVVNNTEQLYFSIKEILNISDINQLEDKYVFQNVIISSVIDIDFEIENYLQSNYKVIKISLTTPIPINNDYKTTLTLGYDRLACAVAAHYLFPDSHCLVIQMGSCITYDFINKQGSYLGGGISPGLVMRFKSLHSYTEKLPLVNFKSISFLFGDTTEKSILSGVIHGIINECNGFINMYKNEYKELKIIATGGDMPKFEKFLSNEVVAYPNLVLFGLSLILNYNVE
ncbi:MAG: type III pantothenate kinase [Bacteroidales bacterium]|nr:type III pantothenate kinase [Bacteroidales bacterium]